MNSEKVKRTGIHLCESKDHVEEIDCLDECQSCIDQCDECQLELSYGNKCARKMQQDRINYFKDVAGEIQREEQRMLKSIPFPLFQQARES